MKFSLAVNMERMSPDLDMRDVARHTLEMVQLAERGGFEIAWAAEHHAIEMTIAPNPFHMLTWWGQNTSSIRLGAACIVAAYWHPIRAAGEAALCDLLTNGRLEFGIGCGAYQREFDRMANGLRAQDSVPHMIEMLPLIKSLWQGDAQHSGKNWTFPVATACPKPLQKPYPPIWAAVRNPISFDWAVANELNVLTWALTRDFSEVETYMQRFEDSLAKAPNVKRPRFATMRHTGVCEKASDFDTYISYFKKAAGQFENLFRGEGKVENGFPDQINLADLEHRAEYDSAMLHRNLMIDTPDTIIAKLRKYEALGVDNFIYYASYGLPHDLQKKSLKLFVEEVMPAFATSKIAAKVTV